MVSDSQIRKHLGTEFSSVGFKNDSRKMGYARITGLLSSDDDPPPMNTKAYKRNPFNEFFCLFTEITYFPQHAYEHPRNDLSDEINKLLPMLMKQVHGLDDSLLNQPSKLIKFLRGSEDDPTFIALNDLSLEIFGGHTEHLVMLCTAKHAEKDNYEQIKQFLENRFGDDQGQPIFSHTNEKKSALIRAYSRLSVAPVYIRGSYRYQDETYYILQLSTKPYDSTNGEGVNPESLRRLHTTFCIKQEEDHPEGTEASMIGLHKQIRIQGGMMQLVKNQDTEEDVFPILLDNTRILSEDDMVEWK